MTEVKISKNNIFVVIAVIAILGSIFAVYAYVTSNPAVFGHSAGEIEGGGSGGTACAFGQVAVGSSCKILPSCGVSEVLSYDGGSFACKGSTTPAYKWTKVCNKTTNVGGTCTSIGAPYGRSLDYRIVKSSWAGLTLKNCITDSGNKYPNKVVSCTPGGSCTSSESLSANYCPIDLNVYGGDSLSMTSNYCGTSATSSIYVYEDYSIGGAIYMCLQQ